MRVCQERQEGSVLTTAFGLYDVRLREWAAGQQVTRRVFEHPRVMAGTPRRSNVTVTGEERHQDALASLHPDGVFNGVPVFAALEPSPISRGKYAGESGIDVRINGERVGELTKAMSDRYLPLVLAIAESGRIPAAKPWSQSRRKDDRWSCGCLRLERPD